MEVQVEVTPETDFSDVSVEESKAPPVVEEDAKPPVGEEDPVKEEPKQEGDEPSRAKEPDEVVKLRDEFEKLKKDRDALGYHLRRLSDEQSRQVKFLEEQLRQEREKVRQREFGDDKERAITAIAHLKETDPDLYVSEYQRILDHHHEKRLAEEREAIKTNQMVQTFNARRQAVEAQMAKDFPDLTNDQSELFIETQKTIMHRYTPEEVAYLQSNTPQVFYDIAAEAAARMSLKKLQAEKANASREQRVNAQGAVGGNKKAASDGLGLTREQIDFCRKNGFDPKEYAKFVGTGRK